MKRLTLAQILEDGCWRASPELIARRIVEQALKSNGAYRKREGKATNTVNGKEDYAI